MRLDEKTLERFMAKVVFQPNGCWYWTAAIANGGYGRFQLEGKARMAHVVIWEHVYGPKPAGTTLDHFECDTPWCVNPEHVRLTTQRENLLRGDTVAARGVAMTHCKHGHEFTPENTIIQPNGNRRCRTCAQAVQRISKQKERDRRKREQ